MADAIKSKKNKDKLVHDGILHIFDKLNVDEDRKFWRCEFKNTKGIECKGRIHTDLNNNFLQLVTPHVCEASAARVGAQKVVTAVKRRAEDTMEPPATIRSLVLQNVPTPIQAQVPSKCATKLVIF